MEAWKQARVQRKKGACNQLRATNRCKQNNLQSLLTAGGVCGIKSGCVKKKATQISAPPPSPHPFFLPSSTAKSQENGEVMYGPSPDRTTQRSRWTEGDRRTENTVPEQTKGVEECATCKCMRSVKALHAGR